MQEEIKSALRRLEEKYHDINGYYTVQILEELNMPVNRKNGVAVRTVLRKLIDKKLYPEFGTAGKNDVVYEPLGKGKGKYRLSIYRENYK